MTHSIHRLFVELEFPEGLSAGEGKDGNILTMARDGRGLPVLRGSSLAGALRHAWASRQGEASDAPSVLAWFGSANDGEASGAPSLLHVPDSVVDPGQGEARGILRTHNAVNRHTGAVLDKGLFVMEALPPGSRTSVHLWLLESGRESARDPSAARSFLADLASILADGLTVGGHAARGVGRVQLTAKPLYRNFDLSGLDDHASWLDEMRAWRRGDRPRTGEELEVSSGTSGSVLNVDMVLGIPGGQDVLVGDGQGIDHEIEPQKVRGADGKVRWRIPGSALRGVFRGWFTRLAARSGLPVADNVRRRQESPGTSDGGDDLAWGFDSPDERERKQDALAQDPSRLEAEVVCPIMRLFGSCYSKGRIHVGDAVSCEAIRPGDAQVRAHVAVDRITGGANEGFFFTNQVLVGTTRFTARVSIQSPSAQEVGWMVSALRALNTGILRIGNSKGAGWLVVEGRPRATGPFSEMVKVLNGSEVVP